MVWAERAALAFAVACVACAASPERSAAGGGAVGVAPAAQVDPALHARVLRMADARIADSAVVTAALASRAGGTRAASVLAIGQVRARQYAPALRALLADADTAVAANAAFALGLMQDSASVPALASALTRPGVGREAAFALGQIGAPARGAIVRALRRGRRDPSTLGELLLAASRLRPVPEERIQPHLLHRSAEVRWRAAYAYARSYAPGGVRPLLDARFDTSSRVRMFAARGLARQAAGDTLGARALRALQELAEDRDPHVRINALRALGTYGTAGRSSVIDATRDTNPGVRIAAAEVLGFVLDSTSALWTRVWQTDTSFAYRRLVLASAARAGATLPAFAEWQAGDWRHRMAVVEAWGAAREPNTRWAAARPVADDADSRVRAAALRALAAAGGDTLPRVRRLLLERAAQGTLWERAAALEATAQRPAPDDVAAVLDAYRVALTDTTNDARVPALRHLVTVWREDSSRIPVPLRGSIRDLPAPMQDPVARVTAGGHPPFEGWPATPGTERPLDWYEGLVRDVVLPGLGGRRPRATLETVRGTIVIELLADIAPLTVHNYVALAQRGYYDGVEFHRVIPNFVVQDGDPTGSGIGGPAHVIRDELNRERYLRGAVGMALSGPDTGGSQYFLTHSPQPHLDGGYTLFGHVIDGFDVLDAIVQGDRITRIRVH